MILSPPPPPPPPPPFLSGLDTDIRVASLFVELALILITGTEVGLSDLLHVGDDNV